MLYLSASGSDEGGPIEEESNYPGRGEQVEYSDGGRRPGSLDNRIEEIHRRMEEKKTKVLSILSKLQDETPHQQSSNNGRSNFEDCEFVTLSIQDFLYFTLSLLNPLPILFFYHIPWSLDIFEFSTFSRL